MINALHDLVYQNPCIWVVQDSYYILSSTVFWGPHATDHTMVGPQKVPLIFGISQVSQSNSFVLWNMRRATSHLRMVPLFPHGYRA